MEKKKKQQKKKKLKFKNDKAVERLVKDFSHISKEASKRASKNNSMENVVARINMKLAQKLDSAGNSDVAKHIADLPVKKENIFQNLFKSFMNKPLSYKLKLAGGGFVSFFGLFLLTAFVLVWYRGTDVPILRNLVKQSAPILSLQKEVETPYGVGVESKNFTIYAEESTFRSLGIVNKVEINPRINFTVNISPDGKSLEIETLSELVPDTEYEVVVKKGTMFGDGSSLTSDYVWKFRTEPSFSIVALTPRDESQTVPVDASIEVEFNYSDLDVESFKNFFTITPPVAGSFEHYGKKIVFLPSRQLLSGHQYNISIKDGYTNSRGDAIEKSYTSTFTVSSVDRSGKFVDQPYMSWNEQSPIISSTNSQFWIGMNSKDISGNIDFVLYSVNKGALVDELSKFKWEFIEKPDPSQIKEVSRFSRSPEDSASFRVELTSYGIYLLEAYNATYGRSVYKYIVYTPMGAISTTADNNNNVWVFNMGQKEVINGAKVDFYNISNSTQPISSSNTDSRGFAQGAGKNVDLIIAEYSGNYAIDYLNRGYINRTWYGMWNRGEYDRENRVFLYTDKPIYKPGEIVNFKAVLRKENDMKYSLVKNTTVTVKVGEMTYYWDGSKSLPIFEEAYDVSNDFGTIEGSFALPKNVEKGHYNIDVLNDGKIAGSYYLRVSDFVKPRYIINVNLDRTKAFSNETLGVSVSGEDYSGIPASGRTVRMGIYKSPITDAYWFDSSKEMEDKLKYYGGSDKISEVNLTLDNQGRASYVVDLSGANFDSGLGVYSVMVWTPDYESFDSQSILVAQRPLALFVKPEKQSLSQGSATKLKFKTVDLWDLDTKGGVRIVVDQIVRNWSEWVDTGNTRYNPATKSTEPIYDLVHNSETVIDNVELTTSSAGEVELELTNLQPGNYTIYSRYGNELTSKSFRNVLYVYSLPGDDDPVSDIWLGEGIGFEIYTDKSEYSIGETAYIDVKTVLEGKGVYMVSRGDVYDWKIVDLTSGVFSLQQVITDQMSPNIQFCMWGIEAFNLQTGNPNIGTDNREYITESFSSNCSYVKIISDKGKLNVEVTSDKEIYEPGEDVKLDVKVTNASGAGVMSEVSINVIDRALLDVIRDTHKKDSPYGIYDAFYENVYQWLSVNSSLKRYGMMGGFGGGGGGDDVRSNFDDVAYWNAKVITDGSGRASVAFVLPDNLTTWETQVLAVTGEDTWVGDSRKSFVTKKDVSLNIRKPEFVYLGDTWVMEVDARNFSNANISGRINLECNNCEKPTQATDISVKANSAEKIRFEVKPQNNANVVLKAKWEGNNTILDSLQVEIPVNNPGLLVSKTQSEVISSDSNSSKIKVEIPSDVKINAVNIDLSLARSFVNEQSLVWVDPTIASSVELSSSIIHNSVFCNYYDQIRPVNEKEFYEDKILSAIDLMSENQASNGGFGWFDYDGVNYELSSYVGVALGNSLKCGVIDKDNALVVNLIRYLKSGLESEEISIEEKSFALYSLSILGDRQMLPYAIWLRTQVDSFKDQPLALSYLILALREFGNPGDGVILTRYLEELAKTSERGATWESDNKSFGLLHSQSYTTAIVYQALSSYDRSEHRELARNWLVDNPIDTYGNSIDAVAVFYSLTVGSIDNIAGRTGVNKVQLKVNNQVVRNFNVGSDDNTIGKVNIAIDSKYLKVGENIIEVERSGKGELYVVSNMRYFSDKASANQAFTVNRSISDFYTGVAASQFKVGQVVLIRTTVTVDRDGNNLVVRDYLPSGFEPVRYEIGNYDYSFVSKWWKWGVNDDVVRYGSVMQNYITFNQYEVKKGQTYTFEYPAVATFAGTYSGGGSIGYLQNFGDVNGYVKTGDVSVGF